MTTCTDVVIQTVSPHQRPRLVDLFERRHAGARPPADDADAALASHLAAWPPHGFGQHATEVGPATRKGGVLVLVRGVTAPPAEVVRFVRDAPMARAVARVYCLGPSPADDQVVQHVVRSRLGGGWVRWASGSRRMRPTTSRGGARPTTPASPHLPPARTICWRPWRRPARLLAP